MEHGGDDVIFVVAGIDDDQEQPPLPPSGATQSDIVQPKSLYKLALGSVATAPLKFFHSSSTLQGIPARLLADIYTKMVKRAELRDFVMMELLDLAGFVRLIKFGFPRPKLISLVATLTSKSRDMESMLGKLYVGLMEDTVLDATKSHLYDTKSYMQSIDDGLQLGAFMLEAGWLAQAIRVLGTALKLIDQRHRLGESDRAFSLIKLECLTRLLHAQARFLAFRDAEVTRSLAQDLVQKLGIENVPHTLLAMWYTKLSMLYFAMSDYENSYKWGVLAVAEIDDKTPQKIKIDVLRQSAKSCILKRQFKRAHMLITQSVKIAKSVYGNHHHKYSDALLDYAFYLLSVDSTTMSVSAYEEALTIRQYIYGPQNLYVAIAEEDLAYALYVYNYSSGRFKSAKEHIDRAIKILHNLLPATHLSLASAKRVKALILEEIALDMVNADSSAANNDLLMESERLHQTALSLSLVEFGEHNVQTAKHYGNLGRLYQSMTRYYDAEKMHQRAIKIKTSILGSFDHEVGLSIGHLASLYNYHLYKFRDAEKLYLSSIAISLRLFGETYSGLEYDYRGLCHVYEMLMDYDKYFEYQTKLEDWRLRRIAQEVDDQVHSDDEVRDNMTLEEVRCMFFQMCSSASGIDPDAADALN